MSTLILDHRDMRLEAMPGRVRLRLPDGSQRDIPVGLLERIVIQARVSLESTLLGALAEAGVAVLILSPRKMGRTAIVLGRPHNDLAVRVAQIERAADVSWCLEWSRAVIARKLRSQQGLVRRIAERRPELRKETERVSAQLAEGRESLRSASNIETIRGIEGASARALFTLLTSVFPSRLEFTGRNRRPPKDPVNAVLSLSYTLLHFEAVRCCYMMGIDPYVGFYHRPSFGRESMACDLIEPLRPRIDAWVWRLFAERVLREGDFKRDRKACLLDKCGREKFYREHEDFSGPLRRALRRECRMLARKLRDGVELEIEQDGDDGTTALS